MALNFCFTYICSELCYIILLYSNNLENIISNVFYVPVYTKNSQE